MFKEASGKKLVFGLIHLKPFPGTPYYKEGDLELSIEKALANAKALIQGGADGCLIQSVDKVYPATDDTDYVRVASLSVISNEVRRMAGPDFKIGVQLMWNCITPSLAVAKACRADFTRCTALIGSSESIYGPIEANPLKVMNYRNSINAQNVDMIAEISGYHFLGEYNKHNLQTLARGAMTVGANAVEIYNPDEDLNNRMVCDIKELSNDIPVVLGGGTDIENVQRRMKYADAVLVGRCFENGNWGGNIDPETVKEYVGRLRSI
jgi:membrane complex biogenesis BtpA family protein